MLSRLLFKTLGLLLLVAAITGTVLFVQYRYGASYELRKLQAEKDHLQVVVGRLTTEKRVAQMMVSGREQDGATVKTTLLFVEYARDGSSLPPRHLVVEGPVVHLDAMVIKFEHGFVAEDDALRGHSIALFCRIYGNHQTPESGAAIDTPGKIPDVYRSASGEDAAQANFEKELWGNFWRLADDKQYQAAKGVRVANGQGVWGPLETGKLYTVTLESDGWLNLSSEPIQGIYQEALKEHAEAR